MPRKYDRQTLIYVVTNAAGEIVGSSHVPATSQSRGSSKDGPVSAGRPVALSGQRVHEVHVSADFQGSQSAAEFHRLLPNLTTS